MLEKPHQNIHESTVNKTEVFKDTLKIDIKENPNNELAGFVEKRKQEDAINIERLRRELGAPAAAVETFPATKEISAEESAERISTERDVKEIGLKQQEQKELYNVSHEKLGILAWEDRAIEAQKNIDIAESRLALNNEQFKEMFGELTDNMREAIPRIIEENKKKIGEYQTIAKSLRDKLKEKQNEVT